MRRWLIRLLVVFAVLGGLGYGGYRGQEYLAERNKPQFRTVKVKRGDLKFERNATGTVDPVLKVVVGSFVSGPIINLPVVFNQVVKEGDLLAEIDPRIYQAALDRDRATLRTAEAEVKRTTALLTQAQRDEKRAMALKETNPDYIADGEIDSFRFQRESLEAQLEIAKANVDQAKASLSNSEANLGYTKITAPVDGIVIHRMIDPGATLASQFQAPELFIIAPEMDKRMWVFASVSEADVGYIRKAYQEERPVRFRVEAYPTELFEGRIKEIRQNHAADQTVVTYPVIVETPNPDMKLMPGMSAVMTFEIEEKQDVLMIPGAALQWTPKVEYVREEDKKLLEGSDEDFTVAESASDVVEANRKRNVRHVWVQEGDKLRAVEVEFGIDNRSYYELVAGDLTEGMKLVAGLEGE